MSHIAYFECTAHNPPIRSDRASEHLDLVELRSIIAHRDTLVGLSRDLPFIDLVGETPCQRTAVDFVLDHPTCPLRIVDEYEEEYPLTDG
jgi:hypothetical protein